MISVRLAKPGDMTWIREADQRCFPDDELDEAEGDTWWIGRLGTEPVGFLGLRPMQDKTGYVFRLGVDPRFRGAGYARELVAAAIRSARRRGYRRLITYVAAANVASINAFVACGFRCYLPDFLYGEGWVYLRLGL